MSSMIARKREGMVFVVKLFGSGLFAPFVSLTCAAVAKGLQRAALLGSTTLAGADSRTSRASVISEGYRCETLRV